MKTDMQKKRVLHIIDSFGTGGAETWLLECVKYLHHHPELNLQFDFLASGGKTGVYDEEIKKYGCTVFYHKYSLKNFFAFGNQFKEILKGKTYHAVHNHTDFVSGWHFLSAAGKLPPVRISHVHNPRNFVDNYVTSPARWFSFRMGRLLTAMLATKITGTSSSVMDEYGYNRWPYKKKRTLPAYCGFEVKKFLYDAAAKEKLCNEFDWDNNCFIALFAGRIGLHDYDAAKNQKNPTFAFDAAKQLVAGNHEWNFVFAGYKGKLGEEMETEIANTSFKKRIKFTGIRKDIAALMSAADILVFPSLWEGLGMVMVEAQAAGLPVLASDTVPAEAVVVKELFYSMPLSAGAGKWVAAVKDISAGKKINRCDYNIAVQQSPFSIENSVAALSEMYV